MPVLKPWTPVKAEKTAEGYSLGVWNRTYTLDKRSLFFSSVVSGGKELLLRPITLKIENKGVETVFCPAEHFLLAGGDDESRTVVSAAESSTVVVNVQTETSFDGVNDITFSIMPRGKSVAQVFFGLENEEKFCPTSAALEIALRKENIAYYHTYPQGIDPVDPSDPTIPSAMGAAGFIPKGGFTSQFKEQIYLGGEEVGLGLFFSTDEVFSLKDPKKAFTVEEKEDCYLLKINIFDEIPPEWRDRGENEEHAVDMLPLTLRFGLQTTPIRPFPENPYEEKNLHIDCYKKVLNNYEDFLSNPVVEGDEEIGFDRIERLGVKTLYIHEKWNDLQNSPILTEATEARLKYIIKECHARGIRVIPYFGYELSTLSPLFEKYGDEFLRGVDKPYIGHWYRYPYQRDLPTCFGGKWADFFVEGLIALQKKYGFDGFYFDSMMNPFPCYNEKHGCGYYKDGKHYPTYSVWQVRDVLKRIYSYTSTHGLTVNIHACGSYNLAAMQFADSIWDGEVQQSSFLKGLVTEIPDGLYRAQFRGRETGLPVMALCYSNPPVWTFESAAAIALLYGAMPKPVDIGEPLELMSKIWKIVDDFPIGEAEWKPYYLDSPVRSSEKHVKVSAYQTKDRVLAFCTSDRGDFEGESELISEYPLIRDAFTGEILSENGRYTLKIKGFQCRIFTLEKAKA